jgi:hypothetical protein
MVKRPQINTDAAPFYFTYIDQVLGDDPVSTIEKQLEEAEALFATISEEKSLYRYAPRKWSIRQLLNHATDTERAFAFRTLWFARGFDGPLPGFDQEIGAAGAEADLFSWASHVDDFRNVRRSTIALLRNLPPAGWERSGVASDNPCTVRGMAYIIPGHFAHHLAVLREKYLQ